MVNILGPQSGFLDWQGATPEMREFYVNSAVQNCPRRPDQQRVVASRRVAGLMEELFRERPQSRRLKLSAVFGLCFARAVELEAAEFRD